jgi:hypothetical protein
MTAGQNVHIADTWGHPVAAITRVGEIPGHVGEFHDLSIYILNESHEVVDTEVITFSSDELAHLIHGLAEYGAMNGLHIDPPV